MTDPSPARATLRYFADMVKPPERIVDVSAHGGVVTVVPSPLQFFADGAQALTPEQNAAMQSTTVSRMVARDGLHPHETLLRIGYGWVVGTIDEGGSTRPVLAPIVSQGIRRTRSSLVGGIADRPENVAGAGWRREGDQEGSHLIEDVVARLASVEDARYQAIAPDASAHWWARFPKLQRWLRDSATAMGFPDARPAIAVESLAKQSNTPGLLVVPSVGVYLARDLDQIGRRPSLEAWATRPDLDGSAFATLYGAPVPTATPASTAEAPTGALPLDRDQLAAVTGGRERISVISGPPGTGKSHTVAALAVDAVHRGESVLVATQSQHAASVIIDFLTEIGAPRAVVFGDNRSREQMVADLYEAIGAKPEDPAHAERAVADAVRAVERSRRDVLGAMRADARIRGEDAVSRVLDEPLTDAAWTEVDADLRVVRREVRVGWWRRRRASRRLASRAGDRGVEGLEERLHARRLERAGGLQLDAAVEQQVALDHELRERFLRLERVRAQRRVARGDRSVLMELGRALRSGRAQRRRILAALDGGRLLEALPLWVGTIGDIDDLLPPTAAMFDLVIVDEASQVDQTVAPSALLRARRLIAAGDPHQLRHTSFASDDAMTAALGRWGLAGTRHAGQLDIRRNSLLDAASAAGPTTLLTTHYRSVPHLIDFSATRFYEDRVQPATRHPGVDTSDRIDVVRLDGERLDNGTNPIEVEHIVELLVQRVAAGEREIGVITPFRAQADLLETRLVETFDADTILEHRLAVGTVHGFQGAERDHMIVSLALDDDCPPGSVRFAQNRHLFNVMVTRARQHCTVITSMASPPKGLIADYIDHAQNVDDAPRGLPVEGWPAVLHDLLVEQGLVVRSGYRVGHEQIDLVVGETEAAFALDCTIHPAGPEAHLRRRMMLAALGWDVIDAFESRWGTRAEEFAIRLAGGERAPGRVAEDGP